MKYKPSIIQKKTECFICRSFYNFETLYPLERHHLLHGTGMRKLADEDGLWVWLCVRHHRELHDLNRHDHDLQIVGQRAYIKKYSREEYFRRYGKFYE